MTTVPEVRPHLEAARSGVVRLAEQQRDPAKRDSLTRCAAAIARITADVVDCMAAADDAGTAPTRSDDVSVEPMPDVPDTPMTAPVGLNTPPRAAWDLDDLSDLPDDLVDELNLRRSDALGQAIRSILADAGRPLGTKQILVACYRRLGERVPPEKLARKLYRMTQPKGRGVLVVPAGAKGRYGLAAWSTAGQPDSGTGVPGVS